MVESLLQEHAATTLLAFRPRNFGKNIVSDEGTLIGCPKTSKWSDLLMAVPRWFAQFGPCGSGDCAAKVYSHFRAIAPTADRGCKKFMAWVKEVSEMLQQPLPVDN